MTYTQIPAAEIAEIDIYDLLNGCPPDSAAQIAVPAEWCPDALPVSLTAAAWVAALCPPDLSTSEHGLMLELADLLDLVEAATLAAYAGAATLTHEGTAYTLGRTGDGLLIDVQGEEGPQDSPPHVFVYGTLQQGRPNHHWVTDVATPDIQPATLHGFALYDLGPFPAIVPAVGGAVHGELLSYTAVAMPAALELIDRLEGYKGPQHPTNLYHREAHAVTLADGATLPAWVYVYARPLGGAVLVEGGRW